MELNDEQKYQYLNAITEDIFKKPLYKITWEQSHTLSMNVITRNRNTDEFEGNESTQLLDYIKKNQKFLDRKKTHYKWMDE